MNYISLLIQLVKGSVTLDGVTLNSGGELNVSVKPHADGVKVDFLSPEPTVSIFKIIKLTDTIDYIRLADNGDMYVKTKSWFSEIPINFSEKT